MLVTELILKIAEPEYGADFLSSGLLSQQIAYGDVLKEMQYGKLERENFNNYYSLTDCKNMVDLADDESKTIYQAFALFVKTYILYYSTMRLGDIPYSEAMQGESLGNFKPKYDTQKEVFIQLLQDLENSYNLFSEATRSLDGDIIFEGDIEHWKKVVTVFRLKVLMSLSKKTDDTDLNVKDKFAKVVSTGKLMTSNDDNLKLTFSDEEGKRYPFCMKETNQTPFTIVTSMLIENLKALNDYRLFYYCAPSKVKSDIDPSSYDAYLPVDASSPMAIVMAKYGAGEYCGFNKRYIDRTEGEPFNLLGYSEQELILAEAITRGWISGDASEHYQNGIYANMKFVADATPDNPEYHHNRKITDDYINSYLSQNTVKLTGDTEKDIEKIILQRYLASFLQYPYESYYNYRRTGYPKWNVNSETCLNEIPTQFAQRWRYCEDEYNVNTEQVNEAVKRQFGDSGDTNNGIMWILK